MSVEVASKTEDRRPSRTTPGTRGWPISWRMTAALAAVLWPLGAFAIMAAVQNASTLSPGQPLTNELLLMIALPVLMWLAALATGWWIARHFVVKPIIRMQRVVRRYTGGETSARLGGTGFMSREMNDLATAFDAMADAIDENQREIGVVLAEQQRLTREVHHRVKNNLQIVASLLSIQSRDAPTREVADAYATVQARVGALALVHRWMYGDEAAHGVDMRSLVTDLCASLEQSLGAIHRCPVHLSCDIVRVSIPQDTAVPIAFLITELLSVAAKLTCPRPLEARVTATLSPGAVTLSIGAPSFAGADALTPGRGDPASRIISGMARQLRTALRHDAGNSAYVVDIAVSDASSQKDSKKLQASGTC